MRICMPWVSGRGAGLGNELVPWCRSILAAQLLGAQSLAPAFGLNPRRYWRHFDTPRWDWVSHRMLRALLPVFHFDEEQYLACGGGDVVVALRRYAQAHDLFERRAFVLTTHGMWGGMHHIEAARWHARSLLQLSRYAGANLLKLRESLDPDLPVVGVHIRMGDFAQPRQTDEYRGRFNVSLPMTWYRRVAESIHHQCQGDVQFLIVSDAPAERLASVTTGLPCILSAGNADADCSDLLALAQSDLLVCSVSSYSVWAAFLSDAPYLWHEPSLHVHAEGLLSIWGHEQRQALADSPTRKAIVTVQSHPARPRGWPVGADGSVAAEAMRGLIEFRGRRASDLVRYGVVADPALNPTPRGVRT